MIGDGDGCGACREGGATFPFTMAFLNRLPAAVSDRSPAHRCHNVAELAPRSGARQTQPTAEAPSAGL